MRLKNMQDIKCYQIVIKAHRLCNNLINIQMYVLYKRVINQNIITMRCTKYTAVNFNMNRPSQLYKLYRIGDAQVTLFTTR